MSEPLVLGIESSCDETAIGLLEGENFSQISSHQVLMSMQDLAG